MRTTKEIGMQSEEAACRYLMAQGLVLLARNFRCTFGEIDLIMQDKDDIVFIEVKFRQRKDFGTASDSVLVSKQRKLIKTGTYYLQRHDCLYRTTARFDVVAIHPSETSPAIEWIKNAFTAPF